MDCNVYRGNLKGLSEFIYRIINPLKVNTRAAPFLLNSGRELDFYVVFRGFYPVKPEKKTKTVHSNLFM